MKRLIVLTLLLSPLALASVRSVVHEAHPGHRIGPRPGKHRPAPAANDFEPAAEKVVRGFPMATPQRAREDAERELRKAVSGWLAGEGVPRTWKAPERLLEGSVQADPAEAVEKDYGTVYVQALRLNASERLKGRLVEAYERELAGRRLVTLGGVLAFLLACLATITGYIRADEATKGYYTNRLRLAAAVGVGAAGVALYRFLA